MKIAVSSMGKDLRAQLDPRFGRSACFIIVDPQNMAFEVVENLQNFNLPQGAGIQAAKIIVDNQAAVLITGHCGPKAFKVLQSAGVKIIIGAKGSVAEVIQQYKDGKLEVAREADAEGHWI